MKRLIIGFCFVCILGCFATVWAHRVNIFAYPDGDSIQIECSFSKSQMVRHGKLTFSDGETGATLSEATTDEHGIFRFRPDEHFLDTGHGLDILLYAGEGHQNTWHMDSTELKALTRPTRTIQGKTSDQASHAINTIERNELEALMGKVLDERLTPIRQAIARQQTDMPGLRDIIGGLGWILGLLGLATYLRYRPRP